MNSDPTKSWRARQLGYIIDLLHLVLDWRLANIIRKLPMAQPGDILLVADPLVIGRLLANKYPGKGPVPIIGVLDVNDLRIVPFKELSEVYQRAYEAHVKGEYAGERGEGSGQSGGGKEGWPSSHAN